jgi:hypothetical protein
MPHAHLQEERASKVIGQSVTDSPLLDKNIRNAHRRADHILSNTVGVLPGATDPAIHIRGEYGTASAEIGKHTRVSPELAAEQLRNAACNRTGLLDLFKISEPAPLPGQLPTVVDERSHQIYGWGRTSREIGKGIDANTKSIDEEEAKRIKQRKMELLTTTTVSEPLSSSSRRPSSAKGYASYARARPMSRAYGEGIDASAYLQAGNNKRRPGRGEDAFHNNISLFARSSELPSDLRQSIYMRTSAEVGSPVKSRDGKSENEKMGDKLTFGQTMSVFPGQLESREMAIARSNPEVVDRERVEKIEKSVAELKRIQAEEEKLRSTMDKYLQLERIREERAKVAHQVKKMQEKQAREVQLRGKAGQRILDEQRHTHDEGRKSRKEEKTMSGQNLASVGDMEARWFSSPAKRKVTGMY